MRALTPSSTAASKSALGMTMNGSLPPSSSTAFFSGAPPGAATSRARRLAAGQGHARRRADRRSPADPVRSDEQRLEHAVRARRRAEEVLHRQRALWHVRRVLEQHRRCPPSVPARRTRNTCQNGKFHGMIASTAPSGWYARSFAVALARHRRLGEHRAPRLGVEPAPRRALLRLFAAGLTSLPISSAMSPPERFLSAPGLPRRAAEPPRARQSRRRQTADAAARSSLSSSSAS